MTYYIILRRKTGTFMQGLAINVPDTATALRVAELLINFDAKLNADIPEFDGNVLQVEEISTKKRRSIEYI